MPRTATVNYHVHKPERQAFELDAGGIVGNLISPQLVATQVTVSDVRNDQASAKFSDDGVEFAHYPSEVATFDDNIDWRAVYDNELRQLLTEKRGAKEVIVFDHTLRIDDPQATRQPARNVHSDYSEEGARRRLIDLLGSEKAREWSQSHYTFVNIWRPVDGPINSAPLGFVRPSSVDTRDWLLLDLVYPDRKGQILGLVANSEHDWIYLSKMTPGEIAFFNIFDNQGLPSIAHSALDMIEDHSLTSIRKSIESRTLIRY